ncbi:MAG TPA: hypothetical protein VGX23_18860 [Actinocrinis sp.]|jgi:hypothetical protein|nr:hypothetical protein [Actinocrinis sp.]
MITSSTYREHVAPQRDLLAAFSSFDHRTTGDLPDVEVALAFRRLLTRLCSLMFLHGPSAPGRFLAAADAGGDLVATTSAFLEHGAPAPDLGQGPSELQQELVHFSRIVDIGTAGFDDARAVRALRRLRNSDRLPERLKVTSELMIVTRSRMLQRGKDLDVPQLRPDDTTAEDIDGHTTVFIGQVDPHYLLVIAGPRRRERRQMGFWFRALTAYLTPAEAAIALWAHIEEHATAGWCELALVEHRPGGKVGTLVWEWSRPEVDLASETWPHVRLPQLRHDTHATLMTRCGLNVTASGDLVHVGGAADGTRTVTLYPIVSKRSDPADLAERACHLLTDLQGPPMLSLECGHIHLDRTLDVDQDTGVLIGAAAFRLLAARQPTPPAITPMLDDDHVLIKLRPRDYAAFLAQRLPQAASHVIVESSPIVRAIVTAVYARLFDCGLEPDLRERGGNLFLQMDQGWYCELFEDIAGTMATGCILFETALLIYRTAPERFTAYFTARFHLDTPVHDTACAILDQDGDHDTIMAQLTGYYAQFSDVTDPRRPDKDILALVNAVLTETGTGVCHLNVLEDYYEVQQHKVRALLMALHLPFRLATIHFNATTGRVVLDA